MRVGIITGTGTSQWPGLELGERRTIATPYGEIEVTLGRIGDVDIAHVSRHGHGQVRLSNHVEHRGNLFALGEVGVDHLISFTVCGAVRNDAPLGALVVFDDFYFPSNRLPDGSLCTWFSEPGQPGRGHWIFDQPFSSSLRASLIEAAGMAGLSALGSGCYGHVDGPRFNSRSEIVALESAGVMAVSQTAGPEVVLAGELELPMALVGYLTNYAIPTSEQAEPVEALSERFAASSLAYAALVQTALPLLGDAEPAGSLYRFDP